jgi:hypothetical protein
VNENLKRLILEHLLAMRPDLSKLVNITEDFRLRIGSLEDHLAAMRCGLSILHAHTAITHKRLEGLEARVERIEKRLRLS